MDWSEIRQARPFVMEPDPVEPDDDEPDLWTVDEPEVFDWIEEQTGWVPEPQPYPYEHTLALIENHVYDMGLVSAHAQVAGEELDSRFWRGYDEALEAIMRIINDKEDWT